MRPRLMTIAGPLEGQLIELTEDETTLGRDPASRIYLEDELVSRQHCSIKHSDGRFEIRDLESRNETYVNSVPIRQRELKHGDRVEMGNSIFFFFVEEEGEIPSTLTEIETVRDRGIAETRSVKGLSPEDSRYLKVPRRAAGSAEPAPSSGTLRGFEILLDISRDISVVHSFEDLEERLLLSLFDAFRAERAAILLDPLGDPDEPTFSSVFVRHREPLPGSKFRVSRTVLTTVLANRQAILSNDIPENPDLAEADSLKLGFVRSLMCAPIRDRGDIRGVLYLDTTSPSDSFDEGDLEQRWTPLLGQRGSRVKVDPAVHS